MPKPVTSDSSEFRCLAFDFDGTLADTFEAAYLIFNVLAPKYGYKPLQRAELPTARKLSTGQFIRFASVPRLRIPRILAE